MYTNLQSPTDHSDDIDLVEKNAIVFVELIQYLDDKNPVISNKRCTRKLKKSLNNIKVTLFAKTKAESYFPLYRSNILWKLESESITDYIIRTENISKTIKEAGGVVSNKLLIAMVLKGLPSNFKPFTTVIT